MTKSSSPALKKGKLRIGDQWNAITIIARSQTHVLKAVCELVENSIDAGAAHISIVRRKHGGETVLEVIDDGKGLKTTQDGLPDFKYVATHICDSLKRYLKTHERQGVHGEFGIGLLGFW
ncbi:MAG: ATP-binding protein, partial [Chitinivibrionales bacterium]|nr:ATP-binding protein [Chitinivibrionales bacterium]